MYVNVITDAHMTRSWICMFTHNNKKITSGTAIIRKLQVVNMFEYAVTQSYVNEFLWKLQILFFFLQFIIHPSMGVNKQNFMLKITYAYTYHNKLKGIKLIW